MFRLPPNRMTTPRRRPVRSECSAKSKATQSGASQDSIVKVASKESREHTGWSAARHRAAVDPSASNITPMTEKPTQQRRAKRKAPTQKADRVENDAPKTLTKRTPAARKPEPVDARARQRARDRAG